MKHYITDKQMEMMKGILESFAEVPITKKEFFEVYPKLLRDFQFLIVDIEVQNADR